MALLHTFALCFTDIHCQPHQVGTHGAMQRRTHAQGWCVCVCVQAPRAPSSSAPLRQGRSKGGPAPRRGPPSGSAGRLPLWRSMSTTQHQSRSGCVQHHPPLPAHTTGQLPCQHTGFPELQSTPLKPLQGSSPPLVSHTVGKSVSSSCRILFVNCHILLLSLSFVL